MGRGAAAVVARRAAIALAVAMACPPRPALAHPLHTTMTELSYDAAARTLNVSLRVFADDFSAAVLAGRARGGVAMPPDSAMLRYVAARFSVVARGTGRVAWRWCGVRREGAALFLCLRGTVQAPPTGASMSNTLLAEVFHDQVNIVQASYEGRRRTLLFTPRDGAKPLW
jgi:hypothetical protein